MAWQDELIELETKLASGALSAEEYRRARDELFAQSQTSSAADPEPAQPAGQQSPDQQEPTPEPPKQAPPVQQAPPQQPAGQPTQAAAPPPPSTGPPQPPATQQSPGRQPPGQPAPGQHAPGQGGPFPPPFQWGQQGPGAPDSTQIIQPVADDQPERTQVVRDDPERTQTVAGAQLADPERTQAVSGIGARQQPQQPNQGWTDDDAPPWANADSAPVIAPNTTWTRQGPESFDSGSGNGNRGRLVGTVVAGVLVLALAVVAVIYFTTTGGENDRAATPTGQAPAAGGGKLPQPTSAAPPPLEDPPAEKAEPKTVSDALAKVPGQIRPGGGKISKSDMKDATFFNQKAIEAIANGGFTGGLFKATTENGANIGVFAFSMRNTQSAVQAAQAYGSVQVDGGIPARREDSQRGVAVFGTPDDSSDEKTARRAVYVLYKRVIVIDVDGSDRANVAQTFQKVLDKQVKFAPPTERDALP